MRIYINNKYFQVDEGATYTMNYNETFENIKKNTKRRFQRKEITNFT